MASQRSWGFEAGLTLPTRAVSPMTSPARFLMQLMRCCDAHPAPEPRSTADETKKK